MGFFDKEQERQFFVSLGQEVSPLLANAARVAYADGLDFDALGEGFLSLCEVARSESVSLPQMLGDRENAYGYLLGFGVEAMAEVRGQYFFDQDLQPLTAAMHVAVDIVPSLDHGIDLGLLGQRITELLGAMPASNALAVSVLYGLEPHTLPDEGDDRFTVKDLAGRFGVTSMAMRGRIDGACWLIRTREEDPFLKSYLQEYL